MKKYLLLLLSILCLASLMINNSDDLQVISYSVSQSTGHFASDDTRDSPVSFDQNYSFVEDQFLQCKLVSVAKGKGLQIKLTCTDTNTDIINKTSKNLTLVEQLKLPKGNYQIQVISHSDKTAFDYMFSSQDFQSLPLNEQEKYQ